MNEAVTEPLTATMPILAFSVQIGFIMVMLGIVLAFVRLAKGPSLPDRVVALDTMTVLIVAFCGLFVFESGSTAFLDVAVVLALIGFLATVALARFVERKADRAPPEALTQAAPPEPAPDIEDLP
ncbi:cation:proton antiporter [Jannaschia sp.]|nr:cation:proton antiporter [Jannaschia sp.]